VRTDTSVLITLLDFVLALVLFLDSAGLLGKFSTYRFVVPKTVWALSLLITVRIADG
jgi:hypothetical protein